MGKCGHFVVINSGSQTFLVFSQVCLRPLSYLFLSLCHQAFHPEVWLIYIKNFIHNFIWFSINIWIFLSRIFPFVCFLAMFIISDKSNSLQILGWGWIYLDNLLHWWLRDYSCFGYFRKNKSIEWLPKLLMIYSI